PLHDALPISLSIYSAPAVPPPARPCRNGPDADWTDAGLRPFFHRTGATPVLLVQPVRGADRKVNRRVVCQYETCPCAAYPIGVYPHAVCRRRDCQNAAYLSAVYPNAVCQHKGCQNGAYQNAVCPNEI